MTFFIILLAVGIITWLSWYAGSLLFKLQLQRRKIESVKQQRIDKVGESIRVIALAIEQQQCNLSEGCIRLHHLLESLPINKKMDIWDKYTGIHALYMEVKDLATHQARAQLSLAERKRQDAEREKQEMQFEQLILVDVGLLKHFPSGF